MTARGRAPGGGRGSIRSLGLVVAASLLGACGGADVALAGAGESTDPTTFTDPTTSTDPTASTEPITSPEPGETEAEPRPMEIGDCLEKVGLDEIGRPVPEYVDCAEPHMFEVTGLFAHSGTAAGFDAERLGSQVKATCRGAYESYTGRDPRDIGNAFGWDPPSEAAWAAGDHSYACYATAPAFEDLVGSVARVPR